MGLERRKIWTVLIVLSTLVVVFICLFSQPEGQWHLTSRRHSDSKTDPIKDRNSDTEYTERRNFGQKEPDQVSRVESVKQHCHHENQIWRLDNMPAEQKRSLLHQVIVSDKYKLLYCYIPKVACSNWKRVIKVLNGKMTSVYQKVPGNGAHHTTNLTFLSDFSQPEIQKRLNTYYKFMFVRDPLARILSAFQNKFFAIAEAWKFRQKYGIEIVEKYRNTNKNMSNITLTEFVRFLVDSDIQEMNEHWKPMYSLCQPCYINYTHIGSLENLQEDVARVLQDVGATDVVEFPKQQEYYRTATQEERNKDFQKVPPLYMRQLISTYSLDYALFGYEPPEILHH